jgi:hypothetical protein
LYGKNKKWKHLPTVKTPERSSGLSAGYAACLNRVPKKDGASALAAKKIREPERFF